MDAHEQEPTTKAACNKVEFVNSSMRINVENAFTEMLGLYSIVVLDVSARLREESKVEMILQWCGRAGNQFMQHAWSTSQKWLQI